MEGAPPLPHCCKCRKDISTDTLRGLSCYHAYCRNCSTTTFTCVVCQEGTLSSSVEFPELPTLFQAYQNERNERNYSKMFEVINVTDVECVKGSGCQHRAWCKYTHPAARQEAEDVWTCIKCDINVEKEKPACPMCGYFKPQPVQVQAVTPQYPQELKENKVTEEKKASCWQLIFCCGCYSRGKDADKEKQPLIKPQKAD